jgi:hypothetical protein
MKIRPVETKLFHAEEKIEERTDMTKLTVAFHDFAKRLTIKINKFIVYGPPMDCVHKQKMYWKNIVKPTHLNNATG